MTDGRNRASKREASVKLSRLTAEIASDRNPSMIRRRSMAAVLLMVILTVAPGLALAATACAPHCCPAAEQPVGEVDDCRTGFAHRVCCSDAPASLSASAPAMTDGPVLQGILPRIEAFSPDPADGRPRRLDAELALRTSPLRLSVVLLI
jgi:hypothetical protein